MFDIWTGVGGILKSCRLGMGGNGMHVFGRHRFGM
jgi:hypothetical protein